MGVSACGDDSIDTTGAPSAEGGWSFTDDLGNTVELDEAPTRIAGLNDGREQSREPPEAVDSVPSTVFGPVSRSRRPDVPTVSRLLCLSAGPG